MVPFNPKGGKQYSKLKLRLWAFVSWLCLAQVNEPEEYNCQKKQRDLLKLSKNAQRYKAFTEKYAIMLERQLVTKI